MPLTDEINQAAIDLGLALNASPEMQELFDWALSRVRMRVMSSQIEMVKALFTRTAQRLSTNLGVKFTDFSR